MVRRKTGSTSDAPAAVMWCIDLLLLAFCVYVIATRVLPALN